MRTPREQAIAQKADDNPVYIDGQRVWLAHEFALGIPCDRAIKENRTKPRKVGCDLHWRVNLHASKSSVEPEDDA